MCLLDGVPVELQDPHWVAHQWLVLGSSFCGCGSSNLELPEDLKIVSKHHLRWLLFCDGDAGK